MIVRALTTARRASTDYGFFLAVIARALPRGPGAADGQRHRSALVPLTGVVTPFLSFGGSAMVANFAALGLLAVDPLGPRTAADLSVFRTPVRWLGGALGLAAVVLVTIAG